MKPNRSALWSRGEACKGGWGIEYAALWVLLGARRRFKESNHPDEPRPLIHSLKFIGAKFSEPAIVLSTVPFSTRLVTML